MKPFGPITIPLGVTIATLLSLKGHKKKSLSKDGAIAAWIVGFLSVASGPRGLLLLIFYLLGTKVTKFRKEEKQKKDADASEGAVRGMHQVLACSAIAVIIQIIHVYLYGEEQQITFTTTTSSSSNYFFLSASNLSCCVISHYATCLADTFASELGILSKSQPILITKPWKKVPPGTNGGITFLGTVFSAVGGFLIGLSNVIIDLLCMKEKANVIANMGGVLLYGAICGVIGSFLDSLLGATIQASYYDGDKKLAYCGGKESKKPPSATHVSGLDILSNAQVNLVSTLVTTLFGGIIVAPMVIS